MNATNTNLFIELRKALINAVTYILGEENMSGQTPNCEWRISCGFPRFPEDTSGNAEANSCTIELMGCPFGPGRDYLWRGTSWNAVLDSCKRDLEEFIIDGILNTVFVEGGERLTQIAVDMWRKAESPMTDLVRFVHINLGNFVLALNK